jgi:hypothetical protein
MCADWTKFKRDDRVRLDFGYHGFPATEGRVIGVYPYCLEIIFDGEEHYRVLPLSMVKHCDTKEQMATDDLGTIPSQTTQDMEMREAHHVNDAWNEASNHVMRRMQTVR